MATSRTIPQAEWRAYFDHLSSALTGKRVEIEAASLDFGDQIVAEWMPLLGITYDSQNDLFDVSLDGLQLGHLIRKPRQVLVQEGTHGIETIAIATEDGVKQVLRLKGQLMLPAAREHAGSAKR